MTHRREAGAGATLPSFVAECATRFGEREALIGEAERWSYADLAAESARVARGLADLGIRAGDRVGVMLPNWPEFFAAVFGIQALGGTAVCLSTMATESELGFYLEKTEPRAIFYTPRFLQHDYSARLESIARKKGLAEGWAANRIAISSGEAPAGSIPYAGLAARREDGADALRAIDVSTSEAPAMIFFTSGSTAHPKGVVHAHRGLVHQAFAASEGFGLEATDRSWGCLPMFFAGGFVIVGLVSFAVGAAVILQDHFDAAHALDLMERERVTFYAGWQLAQALCDHASFPERRLTLRKGIYAAMPAAEKLLARDHVMVGAYGLSETATVVCQARWDDPPELRLRGFGRPAAGVELKLVDPESGLRRSEGEPGEIRLRGPSLMLGYLGVPREETFDDEGFFPTGDIGRLDETGTLRFDGRLKEVIKTAGVNVAAAEVEACLEHCEGIRAAYVVPVPHPVRGENVAAFLVSDPGHVIDAERVLAECRREMASYKVPRHLFALAPDEVPRTATQKVDKPRLRREAAERAGGPSDLLSKEEV